MVVMLRLSYTELAFRLSPDADRVLVPNGRSSGRGGGAVQDGSGRHAVGSWGIAVIAILWAVSFGDWAADEGQPQ